MKNQFKYLVIISIFISLVACKSPVVILATEENIKIINCETAFYKEEVSSGIFKEYNDIEIFKSDFRKEIIKQARDCKCDTLYVDLFNTYNVGYKDIIGGGCVSKYWEKKLKK